MIRHAGLIARYDRGAWRGVLIEGPSGSGKSDLALRALAAGFRLVADDRTLVFASAGRLFGRAPASLKHRLEVRGVGIVAEPALDRAQIILIARCLPADARAERLPDETVQTLLGVSVPTVDVAAFDTSSPLKLVRAMEHLGRREQ